MNFFLLIPMQITHVIHELSSSPGSASAWMLKGMVVSCNIILRQLVSILNGIPSRLAMIK